MYCTERVHTVHRYLTTGFKIHMGQSQEKSKTATAADRQGGSFPWVWLALELGGPARCVCVCAWRGFGLELSGPFNLALAPRSIHSRTY